jgi:hypothetical protein
MRLNGDGNPSNEEYFFLQKKKQKALFRFAEVLWLPFFLGGLM